MTGDTLNPVFSLMLIVQLAAQVLNLLPQCRVVGCDNVAQRIYNKIEHKSAKMRWAGKQIWRPFMVSALLALVRLRQPKYTPCDKK